MIFMKLDKKTAAILLLCLIALVALIFFASQVQQAQNNPSANPNQAPAQNGSANSQAPQGNASNQPQNGGQPMPGSTPGATPGTNITGGSTNDRPGSPIGGQNPKPGVNITNVTNMTNSTNWTVIYPPDNVTIPPATNISLYEPDFQVVDDSLPSLLTSQKPTELPQPPANGTK